MLRLPLPLPLPLSKEGEGFVSSPAAAAAAAAVAALGSIRNLSICSERMGSMFLTERHMSRKRAVIVRKINPKVPPQEAYSIARDLYDVIRSRGPLTVPNTWIQAQEAGVSGLKSKTHLKLMLKWMRGRKMLKLFCNPVGSSKKFLHCTLPEEPRDEKLSDAPQFDVTLHTKKPSAKAKRKSK